MEAVYLYILLFNVDAVDLLNCHVSDEQVVQLLMSLIHLI